MSMLLPPDMSTNAKLMMNFNRARNRIRVGQLAMNLESSEFWSAVEIDRAGAFLQDSWSALNPTITCLFFGPLEKQLCNSCLAATS